MTIEEVRSICMKTAEKYGYKLDIPVEENGRLKSTLGRVTFKKQGRNCYPVKIEFSKELLKLGDKEIKETIAHEMAHYFVLKDTRRSHNHDDLWKKWAVKLGAKPKATVKREDVGIKPREYKYYIFCEKCGKLIGKYVKAGKVVQNSSKYKSGCCHAGIKVMVKK